MIQTNSEQSRAPLSFSVALVLSSALIAGCSTLLESVSSDDSSTGYVQTKNAKGETVYRRGRYIPPTPSPTPYNYVTPTPADDEVRSGIPVPIPTPFINTEPVSPSSALADGSEPEPEWRPSERTKKAPTMRPQKRQNLTDSGDTDASGALNAEDKSEKSRGLGVGLEFGASDKHFHLNAMLLHRFGFIDGKLGFSLFKSGDDLYAGGDLGVRPRFEIIPDRLSLFAGLGAYLGDTKKCVTDDSVESCEKKFLLAGYMETGIYLWKVSLFARRYAIEEAGRRVPSNIFYGVGFHTTY